MPATSLTRVLNPQILTSVASYDVASNICQALGTGGGGRGGLGVSFDQLEETRFEVTLGLTQEQEAAADAEANAPKQQPEWITRNQFEDDPSYNGGMGPGASSAGASNGAEGVWPVNIARPRHRPAFETSLLESNGIL